MLFDNGTSVDALEAQQAPLLRREEHFFSLGVTLTVPLDRRAGSGDVSASHALRRSSTPRPAVNRGVQSWTNEARLGASCGRVRASLHSVNDDDEGEDPLMSQTKLETPLDLLRFQLRTTMTMEEDSLEALGELSDAVPSREIKKLFQHHADETREQIENLRKVFELFEFPASTAGSPSTKGISKQARSLLERSVPALRDQIAVSCALGNEHYEISVYQSLILSADAQGAVDAVTLLTENLDQETHTSDELRKTLRSLVA
ncbi:YciE/YciF ferroxidase family protein [Microbacterium lacticum]